jgi:hypothetical protein
VGVPGTLEVVYITLFLQIPKSSTPSLLGMYLMVLMCACTGGRGMPSRCVSTCHEGTLPALCPCIATRPCPTSSATGCRCLRGWRRTRGWGAMQAVIQEQGQLQPQALARQQLGVARELRGCWVPQATLCCSTSKSPDWWRPLSCVSW